MADMENEQDSQLASRKDIPRKDSKVCGVCGDKALGYNFNAITCESCKAFFRRNALKDKEFKCPFNKNCEINPVTRRFCQLCRLIKCFEIGMKKEYIMTDEDKSEKRKRIEQNKALKKRSIDDTENTTQCKFEEEKTQHKEVKYNLLNMASTSNKTYKKKKIEQEPNFESQVPEPTSPAGASVDGSRTCDMFTNQEQYATSHSRSSEIIRLSKLPSQRRETKSNCVIGNRPSFSQNNILLSELDDCASGRGTSYKNEESTESCADMFQPSSSNTDTRAENPTPLLSSLINSAAEGSIKSQSFRVDLAEEVLSDVPRPTMLSSSIESVLSEAIKLEYEAYSSINTRMNTGNREFNDSERAKVNELIVANKALLAPLDDDIKALFGDDSCYKSMPINWPYLVDVLNLTAIAIRRLIKMAKKINAFKNMCQEDQVALLKGGCTEMMILRSAMTYDQSKDVWSIPHSQENLRNIKMDVLKEAGGKVFEEHRRFLQTFDSKWRMDENIMLILTAITLFTPDRPGTVHYEVIKLEQSSYYYLLRRYLENTYPGCEARSTFLKLIQKISELHRLNEDHVRVYLDVNPRDIEPLLIEIFDLKPR